MESSRIKRRRLILVSSNVSSQRPDLPATFESLIDDTLTTVLEFVGDKSYKSFGGVNKHCKEVYITSGMTKETFVYGYAPLSVIINKIERAIEDDDWSLDMFEAVGKGIAFYNRRDVLAWSFQERQYEYLSRVICYVAAREGRIDILDEVWNNIYDEGNKRYVFGGVNTHASRCGKLNVLKWIETKELSFNKRWCANRVAANGHLHILKWLKEEKGFELFGDLYNEAICGDHFHVMKWLKEQGCPWVIFTFSYAVREKGNLDVLQWLHDEGCPWPRGDDISHVHEEDLEPEVVDWCRVNGYGDRLF